MKIIDMAKSNELGARSCKYLISLAKGESVEIALFEFEERIVICCSSQIGCSFSCRHCATTYSNPQFVRNLTHLELMEIIKLILNHVNLNDAKDIVLDFSGVGDCSSNWNAVRIASSELVNTGVIKRYFFTSIAPQKWCEKIVFDMEREYTAPSKIMISLHGYDLESRRMIIPNAEDPQKSMTWWKKLKRTNVKIHFNYVIHSGNSSRQGIKKIADLINSQADWIDVLRLSHLNYVEKSNIIPSQDIDGVISEIQSLIESKIQVVKFLPIGVENTFACGQMRAYYNAPMDPDGHC